MPRAHLSSATAQDLCSNEEPQQCKGLLIPGTDVQSSGHPKKVRKINVCPNRPNNVSRALCSWVEASVIQLSAFSNTLQPGRRSRSAYTGDQAMLPEPEPASCFSTGLLLQDLARRRLHTHLAARQERRHRTACSVRCRWATSAHSTTRLCIHTNLHLGRPWLLIQFPLRV